MHSRWPASAATGRARPAACREAGEAEAQRRRRRRRRRRRLRGGGGGGGTYYAHRVLCARLLARR